MSNKPEIIYLDNAATTFPKPEPVYQAMDHFYRRYGGNAGRGANPLARKSAVLVDETRILAMDWLQAPHIVFSPSATISLNMAILGANLRGGDVVYTTPFEHNSVLRPLEHLRSITGIEIKILPFDKTTFECDLEKVGKLFHLEPPTMVCITQTSNVIGYMPPVERILTLAKDTNPRAVTIVDGAQSAGLKPIDMSVVDALIFSGHKSFYGPYGIAGSAFGTDWRPEPTIYGGTGTVSESIEMPESGSSRFEAGSHNISAIAGLNAALKWLNKQGRETINSKINQITEVAIKELSDVPNVIVYLPKDKKRHHGVISFAVNGVRPQTIESALGAQDIAVRAGLHCSPWVHEFLDTDKNGGTIRMSIGHLNEAKDIRSCHGCFGLAYANLNTLAN